MATFAEAVGSLPAEIVESRYMPNFFGSWFVVVRFRGVAYRFSYDGREGWTVLERSSARKEPHEWSDVDLRRGISSEKAIRILNAELIELLRQASSHAG